jgi:hypothetical protein
MIVNKLSIASVPKAASSKRHKPGAEEAFRTALNETTSCHNFCATPLSPPGLAGLP